MDDGHVAANGRRRNKGYLIREDFEEVLMPCLLSVNVGRPREVTWNGKTVRTAVWKAPTEGRRMACKLNI